MNILLLIMIVIGITDHFISRYRIDKLTNEIIKLKPNNTTVTIQKEPKTNVEILWKRKTPLPVSTGWDRTYR